VCVVIPDTLYTHYEEGAISDLEDLNKFSDTTQKLLLQADARRRKLVQLRSFDRFDVCILKINGEMCLKLYEITISSG